MTNKINKKWVEFNLIEAKEELEDILEKCKVAKELNDSEFQAAFEHIYHHVNSAWNGKYSSDQIWNESVEEEFYRLRQFPGDIGVELKQTAYDEH